MYLDNATFTTVIANTPLVSIDLIVKNQHDKILLGKRINRPAKDFWFVPGGRILKNETLSQAFTRLSHVELGVNFAIVNAQLHGVYEHFYNESVFGLIPTTHYVAIAYCLTVQDLNSLPDKQHSGFGWFSIDEILTNAFVHEHTKAYFLSKD